MLLQLMSELNTFDKRHLSNSAGIIEYAGSDIFQKNHFNHVATFPEIWLETSE